MTIKAMTVNSKDNVAITLTEILLNQMLRVEVGEIPRNIKAKQKIPKGHKISVTEISKGQPIIKYGEVVGYARRDISEGEHVHVHNVVGGDEVH